MPEAACQTDPVVVLSGASSLSLGTGSRLPFGTQATSGWTAADEAAQAEALHAISLLKQSGTQGQQSEGKLSELEAELRSERASRQEVGAQLAHERCRKEAVQQQVLCLEYELDGKEAALQVAERTLERRDTDLHQVQQQLRKLQEGQQSPFGPGGGGTSLAFSAGLGGGDSGLGSTAGSMAFSAAAPGGEDPRTRAIRTQLLERERQLELKDQHIQRLLNVLRQGRGPGGGPGGGGGPLGTGGDLGLYPQ